MLKTTTTRGSNKEDIEDGKKERKAETEKGRVKGGSQIEKKKKRNRDREREREKGKN